MPSPPVLQAFLRLLEEGNLQPLWQTWAAVALLVLHPGSMTNKAIELYLCPASTGSLPYQIVLHIWHYFMETEKLWTAELSTVPSGDTQTHHLSEISMMSSVTSRGLWFLPLLPADARVPQPSTVVCTSSVWSLSKFWLTGWLLVCTK